MTNNENFTEHVNPSRGPVGVILLAIGGVICFLATIETIGGVPFNMPRSWYLDREIWIGMGVAALIGGFLLQRPPRGDERDTT